MEIAVDQHGNRLPAVRMGSTISVPYSGTAGTTVAVGQRTTVVRLRSTTSCFYTYGKNPTATTSDTPLPADVIEYVLLNPGDKVSAFQESSSGILYVTEIK